MIVEGKVLPGIEGKFEGADGNIYILPPKLRDEALTRLNLYTFSIIKGFPSYQVHGIPAKIVMDKAQDISKIDFSYGKRITFKSDRGLFWWNGKDPGEERYVLTENEQEAKWMTQAEATVMLQALSDYWRYANGTVEVV